MEKLQCFVIELNSAVELIWLGVFLELEARIEGIAVAVELGGHIGLQCCFKLLVFDVDAVWGEEGALEVAGSIELPYELVRCSDVRKACFQILLSRYFFENGEAMR